MELLQVIARIAAGWHFAQKALFGGTVPSSFYGAQVGQEIDSATHRLEGVAEPVRRGRVVAGFDVAPILLDQGPEIGEDAPLVGQRAPSQRFWQWHRAADTRGQELLTKEP